MLWNSEITSGFMMSKDFDVLDKKFMEIDGKMKKFSSIQNDLYPPLRFGNEIMKDIKNALLAAEKTDIKNEYENLFLMNFKEKIANLDIFLKSQISGKIKYISELRHIGIRESDISKIKEYAENFNVQEMADFYTKQIKDLFWSNSISEAETDKIRKILDSFLNISFENSHLKEKFRSFDEYKKTVEIISRPDVRSYHHYGKIYFSVSNFMFVGFFEGNKYVDYPDIFVASRIIGEEGLFGHQGQYLTTSENNIPNFMKNTSKDCRPVNECIGNLGRNLFTEIMSNTDFVKKEYSDILPILHKEDSLIEKKSFIKHFVNTYGDYMKEVENIGFKNIGNYLSKLTGWNYYKSDFFRKKFAGFYAYDFLSNIGNNIDKWSYLYADYFAEKIQKRIAKLSDDEKKAFLKSIMTGYWSKNTFEKYVDWLLKSKI